MTEHALDKNFIISNAWFVFNILLEYCCRSEYETTISTLSQTFHDQLEQVNKKLLEEIKVYKDNLEEKTKEISVIKGDLDNSEAELNKERNI